MILRKIFSERLHFLRTSHNLTQQQLGSELRTSKQNINNWERSVSLPSLDVSSTLADYFDCSLDYLVGRTDNPNSHKM